MKMLHKYLWFILFIGGALQVSAQILEEDTTTNEPFFKARKFDSKCYVGFDGTASQVLKNQAAMYLGVSLNWVINHKFVVTARYTGITTPINVQKIVVPDHAEATVRLNNQFAGLGFSYILLHDKMFSVQPEVTAGWASVRYDFSNATYRKDFGEVIPAVYGIYNASQYFRFGLGINYRIAIGATLNGLKSADVSGLSGIFFIRVGTF